MSRTMNEINTSKIAKVIELLRKRDKYRVIRAHSTVSTDVHITDYFALVVSYHPTVYVDREQACDMAHEQYINSDAEDYDITTRELYKELLFEHFRNARILYKYLTVNILDSEIEKDLEHIRVETQELGLYKIVNSIFKLRKDKAAVMRVESTEQRSAELEVNVFANTLVDCLHLPYQDNLYSEFYFTVCRSIMPHLCKLIDVLRGPYTVIRKMSFHDIDIIMYTSNVVINGSYYYTSVVHTAAIDYLWTMRQQKKRRI